MEKRFSLHCWPTRSDPDLMRYSRTTRDLGRVRDEDGERGRGEKGKVGRKEGGKEKCREGVRAG